MAKSNKLSKFVEIHGYEDMMSEWNKGGENRAVCIQSVGYANEGAMYNELRNQGYLEGGRVFRSNKSDGSDKTLRPRKAKSCLPARVEGWLEARDIEPNDPEKGWCPNDLEPVIQEDLPKWNLFIGKLGPEELASFEAWLGTAATINRLHEQRTMEINAQLKPAVKKYVGKAIESLNEFQNLASKTSWDSDERVYRIRHALAELKSALLDF
jgi:hypothetical protein